MGRGGESALICDTVGVPVVFAAGNPTIQRVVFVIAESMPRLRVADVAIDIARTRDVPLAIVHVALPAYLDSEEAVTAKDVAGVTRRAQLHRLAPTTIRVRGNPIHEVGELAQPDDLVVVTRNLGQRDSFTSPDVALRIAATAKCSTLVLSGERR
jgi:nucleotide-binding universal stress UspA family protein